MVNIFIPHRYNKHKFERTINFIIFEKKWVCLEGVEFVVVRGKRKTSYNLQPLWVTSGLPQLCMGYFVFFQSEEEPGADSPLEWWRC